MFLSTAVYLTPKMRDIGEKDEQGKRGVKPDVVFAEPDPNKTDLRFDEWHKQQVDLAKAELLKLMAN